MGVLNRGTIVFAKDVPPPNGDRSNVKDRRVLVVEPATDANPVATCVVIATLRSPTHNPMCEVVIPSRPDGHPATTLTNPSVAICYWKVDVTESRIVPNSARGRCKQDITNEVLRTMTLLEEENGSDD